LPAISSLAAMHAIKSLGIDCGIKWPNDVLITGKKACGILIEHGMSSSRLDYSILGIGINVNFDTSVFPEIADIATSISMHLNHEVPVAQVAMLLYSELERLYLKIGDPPFLLSQWEGNMVTIGRPVTADFYGNRLEGIAKRVSSNGSLVLQQADGTEKEIIAGDVILRQG
jgi:BirA family biotin operon repressor/biotin-[acetyl-CoA-carboxylase] ligase